MATCSSLKPGLLAIFLLIGLGACSPAQDPAALPTPALSLNRTFDYTNPALQVTATYASDQLTATATQSTTALVVSLGPVRASQQTTDGFVLTIPTADLKPGLTGTYTPDAGNQPFSLQYLFTPDATTQTGRPGSLPGSIAIIDKLERGSGLTISSYDQKKGIAAGRFTLLFFISDPLQPTPRVPIVNGSSANVLVTLTGTFTNLPIARNQ